MFTEEPDDVLRAEAGRTSTTLRVPVPYLTAGIPRVGQDRCNCPHGPTQKRSDEGSARGLPLKDTGCPRPSAPGRSRLCPASRWVNIHRTTCPVSELGSSRRRGAPAGRRADHPGLLARRPRRQPGHDGLLVSETSRRRIKRGPGRRGRGSIHDHPAAQRAVPGHGVLRSWRRTSQMTLIGGARPQAVCRVPGVRDLNSVVNALVVTVIWRPRMIVKGG